MAVINGPHCAWTCMTDAVGEKTCGILFPYQLSAGAEGSHRSSCNRAWPRLEHQLPPVSGFSFYVLCRKTQRSGDTRQWLSRSLSPLHLYVERYRAAPWPACRGAALNALSVQKKAETGQSGVCSGSSQAKILATMLERSLLRFRHRSLADSLT